MPDLRTAATALRAYRIAQARLLRNPANPLRRRQYDDTAYTLCVLMGKRDATEAAAVAERLLAASSADTKANRARRTRTTIP
ncbi:DUF5133 domain-containing protein [Streptomyces sp. IMTB 2501]|uniref:DUF5133 domain-containing protein n=1 Tax=Streptomyces sp. IMTB 2501 TaxID=1776340 RepID=UPI00211705D3|nr:DUF5133 domain-containing protein [Streptomyces sp. IMTB 2501]